MIKAALLVGAGGFAGSVCRYLISVAMAGASWNAPLPVATFTVNALGSLLIGLFLILTGEGGWFFLCVTGFCGGFTTFSAFSAELFAMFREGQYGYGLLYVALSVAVCALMVWAGMAIGQRILK